MSDPKDSSDQADSLRQRAEVIIRQEGAPPPANPAAPDAAAAPLPPPAAAPRRLASPELVRQVVAQPLHELRVHQIELEMQNEELRQTQAELDAAKARYFDLYDLAPVSYVTISEAGLVLESNLTAATLLGVTRSELVRRPLSRFMLQDDANIYHRFRQQCAATGTAQTCELRMAKADGTRFWAELTMAPAPDLKGVPACRMVLSDITTRKLAEAAVAASEEKYRLLFTSAGDAIFIHDQAGRMLAVNPLACERLGYTHAELMALTVPQVDAPAATPPAPQRIARLMEQGQLRFEAVHQRKDGTLIPTEVNARQITWEGQPAIMSIGRDITERQQAAAALKVLATSFAPLAGRAFFEAVSRHIATAIGVDFVFVGAYNPKTEMVGILGGYAHGGAMPDKNFTLTDTPGANVVGQKLCFYPSAVQVQFPQDEFLQRMGIESYLGAPLFDKEGQPIGILVALHTRPMASAQAITQLFDTFLDRVTAEMQRSKAQAALQHLLREKEFLLKEVYHRVKNNLQIVSSLLRLQASRLENPIAQAALYDMQHRVRSMALIHEHLYRSEDLTQVDLAAYLKQLCEQLFRALGSNSGAIRLHLDLAPVQLGIDQTIPCGLLVNELFSNALKHGFPNGRAGEVRVELQPLADGPGWRLRVADDGVGLPAGFDLKHLTTLGLQLIGDLSRQIGGRLEIGPGPGAVFEIVFQASKG